MYKRPNHTPHSTQLKINALIVHCVAITQILYTLFDFVCGNFRSIFVHKHFAADHRPASPPFSAKTPYKSQWIRFCAVLIAVGFTAVT